MSWALLAVTILAALLLALASSVQLLYLESQRLRAAFTLGPIDLSVHFGEPMRFEGGGAEDDDTMHRRADEVKARIAGLIERARR